MTNNIQKAFKTKSKLRAMADGGSVRGEIDPAVLGTGGAARAGQQIRDHNRRTAAEIDALFAPAAAPTPVTAAPVKKPEEKSALRSFFGLADGGQVFKNTVGGVPTFTDARAATAGATAHTPGQGGGTFSVIGMEPAQKQQMADAAAQRQAAANAPTTLGGRLDEALGKLGSPPATAGAPSSTPTLGSELDAAIGRTQGVTSAQTPATGAPANDAGRIMGSQKTQTFSGMSQAAAANAAQMRDIGLQAGQAAAAAARPASPLQSSNFDEPSFELEFADGGKVKGKGGPTEDKVGPVMLSNGEYVLPADTVEIVGRDKLDALRLATHDFVDDGNKPKVSSLRKMADGGIAGIQVDELDDPASRRAFKQAQTAIRMGNPYGAQNILNDAIPRQTTQAAPATAQAAPATAQAAGGTPAKAASRLGTAARFVGNAVTPAIAAYTAYSDSPEARNRAASGQDGLAGASAQVGSYLGSALTFGTSSPQDIGAMTSALRGEGTGAYHAVPDAEKGWARRIGERFLPTESAKIMAGGVQLTPDAQSRADVLRRNGIDVGNMSEDDFTRARELLSTPSPQGATPVADVLGPSAMADESNRRSGGGIDGRYAGAMENYSGLANSDPRINGSTSELYNARGDDDVVGSFNGRNVTKREADARAAGLQTASAQPPERGPTQMDQMRSLLREFGGGGAYGGGMTASAQRAMADINKRYDAMLRDGSGRNRVRGLDWSQRHGLDVERARASELGEFARNQSALRGQDMQAAASANSNRTDALQVAAGMMDRQQKADADAQTALLKAQSDAQKAAIEQNQQGYENFMGQLGNMFPGADGKPDAASQQAFLDFVSATDPKVLQERAGVSSVKDLFSLTPQEQLNAVQSLKSMKDMQDARNAAIQNGPFNNGMRMTGFDAPAGEARDAGFSDVFNRNLSMRDYVYSNLPFTDNRVQQLESGVVVPYDEYVGNSADREKARKSNLRNP